MQLEIEIADVRRELGRTCALRFGDVDYVFEFNPNRNLRDVAINEFPLFGMQWTEDELAVFGEYQRFGHAYASGGNPVFEFCTKACGHVYAVRFDDFGGDEFETFSNSSIAEFIQSFKIVDRCLGKSPAEPNIGELMRTLVDIVQVDRRVTGQTFWWGMIEWSLESVNVN